MGEYFDDKEEDEEEKEIEVEEEFDNIQQIITSYKTAITELNIRIPDMENKIGEKNLYLFGDPKNPDHESTSDKFEEKVNTPAMRGLPFSQLGLLLITQSHDIQKDYISYSKFLKAYLKDFTNMVKTLIKMYKEDASNVPVVATPEQKIKKYSQVKQDMVDDFMAERGRRHIDGYNKAVSEENYSGATGHRSAFFGQVAMYFKNIIMDHSDLGKDLFAHFVDVPFSKFRRLHKKRGMPENPIETTQQNTAQQRGIEDSETQDTDELEPIPEESEE